MNQKPLPTPPDKSYLDELSQLCSKETHPDDADLEKSSITSRGKPLKSVQSFQPRHNPGDFLLHESLNYCAQAACTAIIDAWGKNPDPDNDTLFHNINRSVYFKPDILNGTFGTSPNRVGSILTNYGLKYIDKFIEPWFPGSWFNPQNQLAFQPHWATLWQTANQGFPALVICETPIVGGDAYNLHWLIFTRSQNFETYLSNFIGPAGYMDHHIHDSDFHKAWETAGFMYVPGIRFRYIIPYV